MWAAWRSVRPSLDVKGYWEEGEMIFKKGSLWVVPREIAQRSWIQEERGLVRKIRRKGLVEWGQLLGEDGLRVKKWAELKREFSLDRAARPIVEERIEKIKRFGGLGVGEEGNWWKKIRWKDGAPGLFPRTKFLYRELVDGESCQQKIARGWNWGGQQEDWGRICKKLWKSKLEAKLKVFFWKVIHQNLPVGARVEHFIEDISCRRCGEKETIEHICWTGCISRHLWGGIMTGLRAMEYFSKGKEKEIIPILAWCCWKIRNLVVFEGYQGSARESTLLVRRFASDVIKCQAVEIREAAGRSLELLGQGRGSVSSNGMYTL